MSNRMTTYEEARDWIIGLVGFGIRPGLERMNVLLERLDHPERRLKFIHVAGTNGKGSVCAYLASTLYAQGYDVGMFTSPYITKFTNRFQYNGEDIPESVLLKIANRLRPIVEEIAGTSLGSPTMFEVCTVLALLFYAEEAYPDYVVWETGLGGLLDCTNVVVPVISVITNVGHDHHDVLGDTLAEIAAQKAGIIKSGVPVVTAVQGAEALDVIRSVADARHSTLYVYGEDFTETLVEAGETASAEASGASGAEASVTASAGTGAAEASVAVAGASEAMSGGASGAEAGASEAVPGGAMASDQLTQMFNFAGPFRSVDGLTIRLSGAHQRVNAAVAVMVLEVLRVFQALIVDDEPLRRGMLGTRWPGRLEMLHFPSGNKQRILLDGAHNPEGSAALAQALREQYSYDRLIALIGMVNNKSHRAYLWNILPLTDIIIISEPQFHKALAATELARLVSEIAAELELTPQIIIEPDPVQALARQQALLGPNDLALATGSLYLISDIRAALLRENANEKGW